LPSVLPSTASEAEPAKKVLLWVAGFPCDKLTFEEIPATAMTMDPVIEEFPVSVTVIVWFPTVFRIVE
jgi:hypothetical protein